MKIYENEENENVEMDLARKRFCFVFELYVTL